jgi:hypothetical protein
MGRDRVWFGDRGRGAGYHRAARASGCSMLASASALAFCVFKSKGHDHSSKLNGLGDGPAEIGTGRRNRDRLTGV